MKWDELKNSHGTLIDRCTGREWPLNCVTVISAWWHSISKIEWASNDYITQLSPETSWVQFRVVELKIGRSCRQLETSGGRESHTRPKRLGALMSWGPEKKLIRCNKESHHPAEWALGLRLSSPGERERHNVDGYKSGVQNVTVYVRSPAPPHSKTPHNLFETLQIKREVHIFLKNSSLVFLLRCVVIIMRI